MDERIKNRRAAMSLAEQAAVQGCPIAGAYFGFVHTTRRDELGRFEDDFYETDFEDDSDDVRPY